MKIYHCPNCNSVLEIYAKSSNPKSNWFRCLKCGFKKIILEKVEHYTISNDDIDEGYLIW